MNFVRTSKKYISRKNYRTCKRSIVLAATLRRSYSFEYQRVASCANGVTQAAQDGCTGIYERMELVSSSEILQRSSMHLEDNPRARRSSAAEIFIEDRATRCREGRRGGGGVGDGGWPRIPWQRAGAGDRGIQEGITSVFTHLRVEEWPRRWNY